MLNRCLYHGGDVSLKVGEERWGIFSKELVLGTEYGH